MKFDIIMIMRTLKYLLLFISVSLVCLVFVHIARIDKYDLGLPTQDIVLYTGGSMPQTIEEKFLTPWTIKTVPHMIPKYPIMQNYNSARKYSDGLIKFMFPHANSKVDKILVLKSMRKMFVFADGTLVREYDINLGFNPIGHKQFEGDGKTPEGAYKIIFRNPDSIAFLSLRISYPNDQDIAYAAQFNKSPGGDIMIHGIYNKRSDYDLVDWDSTMGCIGMRTDGDMKELWNLVPNGTDIEIRP